MIDKGTLAMTDIGLEDRLLFALTRQSMPDARRRLVVDICRDREVKWDVVYSISEAHRVAPLIYHNLLQCAGICPMIPDDVSERFELCLAHNVARTEAIAIIISEALAFFNGRGIDVMLIKGAAMNSSVYDQPWYTTSDDVDLVLRPDRGAMPENEHMEIAAFVESHPILECDYFEHHDVLMTGALPVSFSRIWGGARRIVYQGQDVLVMSPEDMLLSACINSCRKRFFRLKGLLDIAEIINRYGDMKWEELTARAREYECNNIVYAALLTTKIALGCDLPGEVLDDLAVGRARRVIIDFLGRKMSLSSLASLFSGSKVFNKKVSPSLLLPYATYRPKHTLRVLGVAYSQRNKSRDV